MFTMSSLTRIIILIIMLILSAFFAMSESAFSYCNQIKLRVKADDGNKSAKLVLSMINKFDKFIVTVLICTNIVHILTSVIATVLCVQLFVNANIVNAQEYGALLSTIATTIVVFFVCEMIPKTIAKARPDGVACFCVYPIKFLDIILSPIAWIFLGLIYLIKKIFKTKEVDPLIDEEDFQDIVDSIEEKGLIEETESDIIQSAVDFDDTKVKQVMCERDNIVALDINNKMSKDEMIDFILDNPYTRIPVYENDIDHIIGILHTQKLLKTLLVKQEYNLSKLLVEPIFVRPNVHLDTIVEEFQRKRTHMAVVQDKEGITLGIITMEDALEELVGDIDESNEGGVINE